jgi:ectoine hydroxylase-related dioxygenase (phytanoyl-CoA dioxygenase family)
MKDGFVILERLIDQALIDQIKLELAPYLQGEKLGRNDFEGFATERIYALLAKSPSMACLIEHETVLNIVDQLLPANYLLSSALAINLHPGETAQRFHIDHNPGALTARLPDTQFDFQFGISTIWALDDFTESNGATQVVPGSHRWIAPHTPAPEEIQTVAMPAGSVIVFLGNLLHRGGANRSDNARLAVTPQYCQPWMRQLENMSLAVPPALAGTFSQRIQSLLGYSVIDPGFMGHVDGLHPKRLIDEDYQGRKDRDDLPS